MSSMVRNAVLGLLAAEGPSHGWRIGTRLEALTGTSANAVYAPLRRLEEAGRVRRIGTSGPAGSPRIMFELTDAGVAEHRAWIQAPPEHDLIDELSLKLLLARREDLPALLVLVERMREQCRHRMMAAHRRQLLDPGERDVPWSIQARLLLEDRDATWVQMEDAWLERVEISLRMRLQRSP